MPPELSIPEELLDRTAAVPTAAEPTVAEHDEEHVAGPGPRGLSDARLVERANEGDLAAFEAIVERYRPAMLARCRTVLEWDAAEDAAQHALLNAWNALRDGCEVDNLRGWLLTIARRCALQTLRSRQEQTVQISELHPGGPSPAEELDRALRTRSALSAVAALPDGEREALVATVMLGRSGRETALALGVSEGMVRQLVHRARARVRDAAAGGLPAVSLPGALEAMRGRMRALARWAHLGAGAESAPDGTRLAGRVAVVLAMGLVAGGVPVAVHRIEGSGGIARRGAPASASVPRAPKGLRHAPASPVARPAAATHTHEVAAHKGAARGAPSAAVLQHAAQTPVSPSGANAAVARGATQGARQNPAPRPGNEHPPAPPGSPPAGPVTEKGGGGAGVQQAVPVVGAVGQTAGQVVSRAGESVSQVGTTVARTGETVGSLGGGATKGAGEVVAKAGEAVQHVGEAVSKVGEGLAGIAAPKSGAL